MEGYTEFAASSLQVFFFTAMTMLTDTLGPHELVPLHNAATAALSISAGFRIALFAKRKDITIYNKHAGKTESPFTVAHRWAIRIPRTYVAGRDWLYVRTYAYMYAYDHLL